MRIEETVISKAILQSYYRKFTENLETQVAIVGGGPSGLTAAYFLANNQIKVSIFERKLSLGGGMWGGGMMFNQIVVQREGREILAGFGVSTEEFSPNYWVADAVEAVSTICSQTAKAGAKIFNLISAEDVTIKEGKATGLVLNWTAVETAELHVDPLCIKAQFIVDATGHPAKLAGVIQEKVGLKIPSQKIVGEGPMWAEAGEKAVIENTQEVYPGVFVAGMAANAVFGAPRMGPIFGGMLLSGKRVAELIQKRLQDNP